MSTVLVQGNDFCGKFYFKDSKKAFDFYFEQCKDDRFTLISHDDKPYDSKEILDRLCEIKV